MQLTVFSTPQNRILLTPPSNIYAFIVNVEVGIRGQGDGKVLNGGGGGGFTLNWVNGYGEYWD